MSDGFQELPIEVIELIIKQVPEVNVRASIRFVCKSWREIAIQHLKSKYFFLLMLILIHSEGLAGSAVS